MIQQEKACLKSVGSTPVAPVSDQDRQVAHLANAVSQVELVHISMYHQRPMVMLFLDFGLYSAALPSSHWEISAHSGQSDWRSEGIHPGSPY